MLAELTPDMRRLLSSCRVAEVEGNRLVIECSDRVCDWMGRYGRALGDHVRRVSEFEGIVIRRAGERAA